MSASLVGSEMCIRDRLSPASHSCDTFATAPTASSSSPSFPAVRKPRSAAVSYTHLTLPTICSV
eukprot:5979573-Alexandrium_andersonii.AAC.1